MQEVAKTTSHGLVVERLAGGLAKRVGVTGTGAGSPPTRTSRWSRTRSPGGGGGPFTEAMAGPAAAARPSSARASPSSAGFRSRMPRSFASAPELRGGACVPPDPIDCNAAGFFDSRSVMWARSTHRPAATTCSRPISRTASRRCPTRRSCSRRRRRWTGSTATAWEESAPDVFVGDFNSEEGSPVYEAVTGTGWTDTYRKANRTAKGYTSDQDPVAPKATVELANRLRVRPPRSPAGWRSGRAR